MKSADKRLWLDEIRKDEKNGLRKVSELFISGWNRYDR